MRNEAADGASAGPSQSAGSSYVSAADTRRFSARDATFV